MNHTCKTPPLVPKGGIKYIGTLDQPENKTFNDIEAYTALGAWCQTCEHTAWLDRWGLQHKWGRRTYLGSLRNRLRCMVCNNKQGNQWIIGQVPR